MTRSLTAVTQLELLFNETDISQGRERYSCIGVATIPGLCWKLGKCYRLAGGLHVCSLCLGLEFRKWMKPVLLQQFCLPLLSLACQFLPPNCPLVLAWVLHGYIVNCIRTEPEWNEGSGGIFCGWVKFGIAWFSWWPGCLWSGRAGEEEVRNAAVDGRAGLEHRWDRGPRLGEKAGLQASLQIFTLQLTFCWWMCQNVSALQFWSCRFQMIYESWRWCCFSRLGRVSCCSC